MGTLCWWWRQNWLSRWFRIAICFPHWNQIDFEQYHFLWKKGSTINVMWPQGFILGPASGASRLHANKYEALPPRHYTMIKYTWKSIHIWVCLYQNKNNVRFKTSFSIGIQQLSKKYCSSWLCTLQIIYRPLVTCNKESFCLFVDNFCVN